MGTTARLAQEIPESETHWHEIAARAHRARGISGDEAAAKTHELRAWEIRRSLESGSSRFLRLCPSCLVRDRRYILIFMGGRDRCGTCGWA